MSPSYAQFEWPSNLQIRPLLILVIVSMFITGPPVAVGPLDLVLLDLLLLILGPVAVLYFMREPTISVPKIWGFPATAGIYYGLALAIPVSGFVLYQRPVGYLVGDLRWLQLIFVGMLAVALYSRSAGRLIAILEDAFRLILALSFLAFLVQLVDYLGVADMSPVLDVYYYNRSVYGGNGHHIGRFAGANVGPSGLGLISVVGFAIFAQKYLAERSGALYCALAVILLVASGTRTSLVAFTGVLALYTGYAFASGAFPSLTWPRLSGGAAALSVAAAALYYFNVGRVASSDRYREVAMILFDWTSWIETSGRAGRWGPALERAREYPLGTLSNPVYVLNELEPIDSYYVLSYVQGGLVLLGAYLAFLCALAVYSLRLLANDERALVPTAFTGIIATCSLTQNFITGLNGKGLLVLASVLLLCLYGSFVAGGQTDQ